MINRAVRTSWQCRLEELLRNATEDRSRQNEFYDCLCSAEAFALTDGNEGESNNDGSTALQILSFEDMSIPIFSSQERIFDNNAVQGEVSVVKMKVLDIFRTASHRDFILNPFSNYAKKFTPHGVERLLDGTYASMPPSQVVIPKGTTLLSPSLPSTLML